MDPVTNPLPVINKYKEWIIIGVVALMAASLAYGLTQLSFKKEREQFNLTQTQYAYQKQVNQQMASAAATQTQQMEAMQTRMDQMTSMNRQTDHNQSQVVIKETYDPVTGKLIEKMSTKIDELEKTVENSKTETHEAATSTATITTTASSTVKVDTSTKETAAATSTVISDVKTKTEVKPAAGSAQQMRFSIGAVYHNNRFKPVAGYTVPMLGVGKIIQVGPGLVAGSNVLGASVQADFMKLPRIGIGYGCDMKMKNCGILESIGIRLDF